MLVVFIFIGVELVFTNKQHLEREKKTQEMRSVEYTSYIRKRHINNVIASERIPLKTTFFSQFIQNFAKNCLEINVDHCSKRMTAIMPDKSQSEIID